MSVKLMVPGELALVKVYNPRYAYAGRADCPPGLDPAAPVEFEVELVDFEREGHWQADLRKAVTAANTQIFKLVKACASINGPVSLVRGLTVVFQDIREKIIKAAGGSAVQLGNIVSFKPIVTFNEEGEMDFDFDVKIDLPEFQGMGLTDIVKALPVRVTAAIAPAHVGLP
uniref:Peptidylprolyl isomerase n=1 Tax=Haematococcus lacustris TaxID=44745 RepID=A0A699ZY82_HAELA